MRSVALSIAAAALGAVHAYNNGLSWAQNPPMGWATWCTDDFCGLLDWCSEQEVRSVVDAMVSSGMRDLGYKLVLLDDCWTATTRDADGNLQPDPTRFPSGIPALVDYVHSHDMHLGLYTCAGPTTCKYGRTGSGGHYEQDAKWFAANKVDYVKMDNCHHPSTPPPVYYGNFSAYLNATGTPTWFATCEWGEDAVWTWGGKIAQSFRVDYDHLPFWSFEINGQGQGVVQVTERMAAVNNYSAPYGWADPDFLMTGMISMSDTESETEFALWSIFGGPMLMATDPRNMSAWKRSVVLNKDIIAVNQDTRRIPGSRVWSNTTASTQLWTKPLVAGSIAALLVNTASDAQYVSFQFSDVGIAAGKTVAVYDLWQHKVVACTTGGYGAQIPSHGNAYFRLHAVTPSSCHPLLEAAAPALRGAQP